MPILANGTWRSRNLGSHVNKDTQGGPKKAGSPPTNGISAHINPYITKKSGSLNLWWMRDIYHGRGVNISRNTGMIPFVKMR